MSFVCNVCGLIKPNKTALDKHMLKWHRYAKNAKYACDAPGCGVTYDKYRSYQTHRRLKHPPSDIPLADQNTSDLGFQNLSDEEDECLSSSELTSIIGHFLLQIRADDKLSDKASENLAKHLEKFTADFGGIIKKNVVERLENAGETSAAALVSSPDFSDVFSPANVFQPFRTVYLQDKYFRENFRMVEPLEIKLGKRWVKRKVKGVYKMKKEDCVGYVVPLLSSLSALLKMPDVANNVLHRRQPIDDLLRDIHDGTYCQNDLVLSDPSSLKILAYCDEFTAVNPIGTHTKTHKYLAFYYVLCNIRPEYRSRLATIQLFALARSIDVKRFAGALEKLLDDFVVSMNALRNGVQFEIDGTVRSLCGGLVAFSADTLASQSIGGFAESVGNANSPCRTCDIHKNAIKSIFIHDELEIRSEDEHLNRLRDLDNAIKNNNSELMVRFKREWGIKSRSPLLAIKGVKITRILLHDPQHMLLEGIDHLVLKLSLRYFIECRFLTLENINSAIQNFEYKDLQLLDKPNPITQCALDSKDNNLRQSAAAMMNLILLFPYMWGHRIPRGDKVWENLIRLRKINIITLSPICNSDTMNTLKILIAEHHFNFIQLFPSAPFIPKLHFVLHFSSQMESHGPLRYQYNLRFEAKHGQFKSMNLRNFKNPCKTMAFRHQRWICSKMMDPSGRPNRNFLYEGDCVGPGCTEFLKNSPFSNVFESENVYQEILLSESVKIHGHIYKPGTVLVLQLYSSEGFFMPTLAEINSIGVFAHQKAFYCELLCIQTYSDHFGAYEVEKTNKFTTMMFEDFVFKWPQLKNKFEGKTYVTLFGIPSIAIV